MNSFFRILEALQPHRIIQLFCHKERKGKERFFWLIAWTCLSFFARRGGPITNRSLNESLILSRGNCFGGSSWLSRCVRRYPPAWSAGKGSPVDCVVACFFFLVEPPPPTATASTSSFSQWSCSRFWWLCRWFGRWVSRDSDENIEQMILGFEVEPCLYPGRKSTACHMTSTFF